MAQDLWLAKHGTATKAAWPVVEKTKPLNKLRESADINCASRRSFASSTASSSHGSQKNACWTSPTKLSQLNLLAVRFRGEAAEFTEFPLSTAFVKNNNFTEQSRRSCPHPK
eukprot:4470185-Amphidinium_carterae.1